MPGAAGTPAPTLAPLLPHRPFLPAAPRQTAPLALLKPPHGWCHPRLSLSPTPGQPERGCGAMAMLTGAIPPQAARAVPHPRHRNGLCAGSGGGAEPSWRTRPPLLFPEEGPGPWKIFPPPPCPVPPPILFPLCQQQLGLPMRSLLWGPAEPWRTRCTRRRAAPARPQPPRAGFSPAAGRAESSGVH